jgi:hypothetical protein
MSLRKDVKRVFSSKFIGQHRAWGLRRPNGHGSNEHSPNGNGSKETMMPEYKEQATFIVSPSSREGATLVLDGHDLPRGKPRVESTDCSCGGMLRYGLWPFESRVNGERIQISAVYHFYCEKCHHRIFLTEVSEEIRRRVERAKVAEPARL